MSEVKWTADQMEAIKADGKGIVVSAAAGSGKTAVLIERVIRQLTEKNSVPADRLLAVTFTTAAAAQLRDKLNEAFEKRLKTDPDNEWLLKQQNLLQLAKISTIDAFCFDMVKENLHKFDFQGGVKILDETDITVLFKKAFGQALDEMCRNSPEKYSALYNAFCEEGKTLSSSRLYKYCFKMYGFLRSLAFRDDWKEKAKTFYHEDNFDEYADICYEQAREYLAQAEDKLRRIKNLALTPTKEGGYIPAEYISGITQKITKKGISSGGAVDQIEGAVKKMLIHCDNGEWDSLCALYNSGIKLDSFKLANTDGLANMALDEINTAKSKCSELKKDIFKPVLELFRATEKRAKETLSQGAKLFEYIVELTENTEKRIYEYKLEKNGLEFSDVMLMAKELLVEKTNEGIKRTELAENIRQSGLYRIILIDEFQDVNNLQEIIFRAVSDSDDLDYLGKNVFVVGDMKQAIYGFRLTNPELFKKNLQAAGDEANKEFLQAIYLKKNFRSRKEVIDFTNFVFGQLMSADCGDVEYSGNERLEQGANYSGREVPVEIMLIDQDNDFDKTLGFGEENFAVAKRIKEMLDEGHLVYSGGEERPCKPADFCVLVTANEEKKRFAKALEKFGIKAKSEDESGYLRSREISIAVDMLRVIDNPMNDIALAAVMMSPIFAFSAEDMTRISLKCVNGKNGFRKHIFQILVATDSAKTADEEKEADYIDLQNEILQKKCERTYRLISELRYCAMCMTVDELIRRIFDKTDLMGVVSMYRDSLKKRANLRLLLEYAQSYNNSNGGGVSGFLRYLESVTDDDKAFQNAVTVTESENSADVITYHKSKGLEYPFVFLGQLNKDLVKSDSIYFHNSMGCAFEFADNGRIRNKYNLYFNYLKRVKTMEDKSERMRLFYVGCTRAKEKLFVCYSFKNNECEDVNKSKEAARNLAKEAMSTEDLPAELVRKQKSMLDWVTIALARMKGNGKFFEWLGIPVTDSWDKSSENVSVEFRRYAYSPEEEQEEEHSNLPEADPVLCAELFDRFLQAENDKTVHKPSKLTVTEIVREEIEREYKDKNPEFYPNLPRLDDELDKLSSAEKGTFTHKFMELADYENAEKSVSEELKRLVGKGYFTKKEASGVYTHSLKKFFGSEFYARMKNSVDIRREQKFLAAMRDLDLPERLKEITDGDGMLQGIADCIFKESDGWVLVDYKTDNFQSMSDTEKYGTQLQIYKAAFELILGEKIKSSYIYSFKLGEGREFVF